MFNSYENLIQGLLEKGFGSVDRWFSAEELADLRKSLLQRYANDKFHNAGIGDQAHLQVLKAVRKDQIYWLDPSNANTIETLFFEKMEAFVQYLNRTCYAGIQEYEFHYAVYEKGAYYKKHVDQFKTDARRQFSFVCYLTECWEQGDGGELLLYLDKEIVKIEPLEGRTIFFSSELPHEVLLSHQQRLSLTGWLKSR